MKNILAIIQLIISLALIVLVLLQDKGEGISETFGGGGGEGGFSSRRRGLEKVTHIATIIAIVTFGATSLAILLL